MAQEITRIWRKNAFWSNDKRDRIEAILVIVDEEGRKISQQLSVKKIMPDGDVNPDFEEIIADLGEETLTNNTTRRLKEREELKEQKKKEEESKRMVDELGKLFEAKVKTLEIEEIKTSKNKDLKSRLRRSKNIIEMQTYAQLIIMEQMGVKFVIEENDAEETE